MSNAWPAWSDGFSVIGEITDDAICVKTRSGAVRRLAKDRPATQRARFFDEVFDDLMFAQDRRLRGGVCLSAFPGLRFKRANARGLVSYLAAQNQGSPDIRF